MQKIQLVNKQIMYIHKELRNVKAFFKESAYYFMTFHNNMKNALSKFNNDDLFNDLHYTNFTHVSIVEHFTHKIKAISEAQSNIHKHLKKEGNKLKVIEKELSSKHKTFSLSKSNKHLSPNKTDNTLIINASKLLHSTRNNMKEAFETYISLLYSFGETNSMLTQMLDESIQKFNDNSPVFSQRVDTIVNCSPFYTINVNKCQNVVKRSTTNNNNINNSKKLNLSTLGNHSSKDCGDKVEYYYTSSSKNAKRNKIEFTKLSRSCDVINENPEIEKNEMIKGEKEINDNDNNNIFERLSPCIVESGNKTIDFMKEDDEKGGVYDGLDYSQEDDDDNDNDNKNDNESIDSFAIHNVNDESGKKFELSNNITNIDSTL